MVKWYSWEGITEEKWIFKTVAYIKSILSEPEGIGCRSYKQKIKNPGCCVNREQTHCMASEVSFNWL